MEKDYLRIGKISSINYPNGTARITYEDKDDSTTSEMPFLVLGRQYWHPEVGEQVLVAHLSNGTCAAVILGTVWHDGHRPIEGFEGLDRRDYCNTPGKAVERYDEKSEDYTLRIAGDMTLGSTKSMTFMVGENAAIQISDSGAVTVITSDTITVTAPKIKATVPEIEIKAETGINIDTPAIKVTGDVIAGTISLQKHIHDGDSGGETSKPKE